jgi:hypothetical protein
MDVLTLSARAYQFVHSYLSGGYFRVVVQFFRRMGGESKIQEQ